MAVLFLFLKYNEDEVVENWKEDEGVTWQEYVLWERSTFVESCPLHPTGASTTTIETSTTTVSYLKTPLHGLRRLTKLFRGGVGVR